jgi:hypothetical protein
MILTNVDDYFRLLGRYCELLTELVKIAEQLKNFDLIYVTSEQENEKVS